MSNLSSNLVYAFNRRLKWALIISGLLLIANVVVVISMAPNTDIMDSEPQESKM